MALKYFAPAFEIAAVTSFTNEMVSVCLSVFQKTNVALERKSLPTHPLIGKRNRTPTSICLNRPPVPHPTLPKTDKPKNPKRRESTVPRRPPNRIQLHSLQMLTPGDLLCRSAHPNPPKRVPSPIFKILFYFFSLLNPTALLS